MKEKELLNLGYKKYSGDNIDIFFHQEICEHSGKCINGSNKVFDTDRRPWIVADNENYQKVKNIIHQCPSGALKYILK